MKVSYITSCIIFSLGVYNLKERKRLQIAKTNCKTSGNHLKKIVRKGCIFFFFFLLCNFKGKSQSINPGNLKSFKIWLKNSWLKDQIKYDTVRQGSIKNIIYLKLVCHNDCSAQWDNIEKTFQKKSLTNFENYLFEKVSFLLEIPPSDLIIRLSNETKDYDPYCFLRRIEFKDSLIVEKADCKDVISSTNINASQLNPVLFENKTNLTVTDDQIGKILELIYSKSSLYYKKIDPEISIARISNDLNSLCFEVVNLKNEVIPTSHSLKFKSIEILRITIQCITHNGFVSLIIRINGKYGSNSLRPWNMNGYNDMELMYKAELQKYADVFLNNKILEWLRK